MIKKIPFTFIFVTIALFSFAAFLNNNIEKPPIKINKQESALNLQNSFYRFTFAGYKRLVSDVLWITTLLESDVSHYKEDDLNNWMFLRFNSITSLDPKFLAAYTFGAQYLSIVKDDPKGASIIFEKGLKQYPENYALNFNAAYLYGFELNNYERAVQLYQTIKDYPQAPTFLHSLITRMKFAKDGNLSEAFLTLTEIYKNSQEDRFLREKIASDLYAIKATMDLKCLNSGKVDCPKTDFEGNYYIFDGSYKAIKEFVPYKLHKKKGAN